MVVNTSDTKFGRYMKRKMIIRTSTIPASLEVFLKGFLNRLSEEYEVLAVSSPGERLEIVREREGVRTIGIPM